MVLTKIIHRGHNLFGHKREKIFLVEMTEEEYVDYVRTHKVSVDLTPNPAEEPLKVDEPLLNEDEDSEKVVLMEKKD